MESINDLKIRLEEIASLVDIAHIGAKKGISLNVLLSHISEYVHNTIIEFDNFL